MKVPLTWLRDYVDLSGIGVPQLVERLTFAGLEVASVRCVGVPAPEGLRVKADDPGPVWAPDKVVVGRVLKVEKHPNANKLKLVTADYGAAEPKVVVTLDADEAPAAGTPAADFMGDTVIEIDVLPNMARCLSMIGVAREVAALFSRELRLPPHVMRAAGRPLEGKVRVQIEDPKLS